MIERLDVMMECSKSFSRSFSHASTE